MHKYRSTETYTLLLNIHILKHNITGLLFNNYLLKETKKKKNCHKGIDEHIHYAKAYKLSTHSYMHVEAGVYIHKDK